jgi:hypothetical protein
VLRKYLPYLLPLFFGSLILTLPLVRDFHFESAMIAAIAGCYWAGFSLSRAEYKTTPEILFPIIRSVYLFGIPAFLLSIFSGCLSWQGIGFWILLPLPSIFFGAAIGRLFNRLGVPIKTTLTILVLLAVSLGSWILEFFTLPQVYFFNHVWGAWPGPIYDETVRITSALIWFRLSTLCWILLLWSIPSASRVRVSRIIGGLSVVTLFLFYMNLPELGSITPRDYLKKELGHHHHTEHFELYFAGENFEEEEMEYWAQRHEFHFRQITEQLQIDWPENRKIESFIYANAWQKKELVGAKFTSYVPIWLEQDQLHIAKQHLDAVLKHELVHVVSKQFGNDLFNGTWSIGLIEGLAEGIAKDASNESTLDQIMAANPPYPTPDEIASTLSVSGFYSNAGAISYTTMGSFVQFLLSNYPVEQFKEAYAHSDFESAYDLPMDSLVASWILTLPETQIDSLDRENSAFIFSQRSVFQKHCPHSVTQEMELWDQVQFHKSNQDDSLAFDKISELRTLLPDNELIQQEWMSYKLRFCNYGAVSDFTISSDSLPSLLIMKADAFALRGQWNEAYDELERVWNILPYPFPPSFEYSFEIREDTTNWIHLNAARYLELMPPLGTRDLNTSTETVITNEAIRQNKYEFLNSYAHTLIDKEKSIDFFSIYLEMTDRLIFQQRFEIAQEWIDALSELDLRPRYQERLQEQQEWLDFMLTVSD